MFEIWNDTDLTRLASVKPVSGRVFSQDSSANKIGVNVYDGGEPVTLSGTVKANIIKANGETITVTGNKSGNQAWVVLPADAYTVVGKIGIYLRIEDGTQVITLGGVEGYVYRSQTAILIS